MSKVIRSHIGKDGQVFYEYEPDPEWVEGFNAAYAKCISEGDGRIFPSPPPNEKRRLFLRGWAEGVISGSSYVRDKNT